MNGADVKRLTQKAVRAESSARVSNDPWDWRIAAQLWREAGDEERAERCEIEADKLTQ